MKIYLNSLDPLVLFSAIIKTRNYKTKSEWVWTHIRASFLTSWTSACGDKVRVNLHHKSIVEESPSYQSHTDTHMQWCWCLFLHTAQANNWAMSFSQSAWQPSVQRATTPASNFFFSIICGNDGTQRPALHSVRGLLFLSTACSGH